MANVVYNAFKKNVMNGVVGDMSAGGTNIKCMLTTVTYNPDQDTHEFVSSVTNEVSGAGYTAGGQLLTGKAISQDNTLNRGKFTADNPVWTAATITARKAVFYRDTGTPSTSPLISCHDFGADITSTAGDFTVVIPSDGIAYIGDAA